MLMKIVLPIVAALCCWWLVLTYWKRRLKKQLTRAITGIAALPLNLIPDIAAGFARFVKDVHGKDLTSMDYYQQLDYVLKNQLRLWRPEISSYIHTPGSEDMGKGLTLLAAGAYLGELVRVRQTAQWKKNADDSMLPPYLEVTCTDDNVIPCNPFEMVLASVSEGKTVEAIGDLLLFESREIMDNYIRTFQSGNVYSPEEAEAFDRYVEKTFGKIRQVFHEKNSPEMHIDVYIIEPSEAYPAVRLLTCGMGARVMEIEEEFREVCPDRLELMIDLPTDWPLEMESLRDERNFWPIRILKILARFPWDNETWLGFGHTIPWPEPFAENTKLTGVLLGLPAVNTLEESEIEVSPGKKVQIFQVIPIYQEEMDYKVENDADKLFELWGDSFSYVVDPQRKNGVTGK